MKIYGKKSHKIDFEEFLRKPLNFTKLITAIEKCAVGDGKE
jgi:hypothetical protein